MARQSGSRRRRRESSSEDEESASTSNTGSESPSRSRRRKSSSRRWRNRSEDSREESDTDSGSDSRRRRRSRRSSRRRRSEDSSESESEEERSRKKRKITEEEIIEYMAKKSQKKALKVAKKLKSQAVSGYSNDSNPFGDSNLGEKFVWRKKIERDVVQGRPLDISVKAEKKKQKERMARLKEIYHDLLRKHLERLQHPMETEQEVESDKEKKTEEDVTHNMDGDQQFSPQILTDESMHKLEEEPGSFSPQLLHADEDEDAIDPESDQAVLESL